MTKTLLLTLLISCTFYFSCTQPNKAEKSSVKIEEENQLVDEVISADDSIENKIPNRISVEGYDNLDKQWLLGNVFIHTLVNKEELPEKKFTAYKFINEDRDLVDIGKHQIALPCQDTTVVLEDLIEDEYGYFSNHCYIGKVDILDAYLIFVEYSEVSNYLLVSIKTGEIEYLDPYLTFSPDGKFMICAGNGAPDVTDGYIMIYKIADKQLQLVAELAYDSWATNEYASHTDAIWGADNSVYITLKESLYADNDTDVQYLKIKMDLNKLENAPK